ncbi:hypothetical protein ACFL42_04420 [Candidatus Omnitrophota bacterium]
MKCKRRFHPYARIENRADRDTRCRLIPRQHVMMPVSTLPSRLLRTLFGRCCRQCKPGKKRGSAIVMKTVRALVFCAAVTGLLLRTELPAYCFAAGREMIFDKRADMILIGRDNDIYITSGHEGPQLRMTASPDIIEQDAFFSADGRFVFYKACRVKPGAGAAAYTDFEYYMHPIGIDEGGRMPINEESFKGFRK